MTERRYTKEEVEEIFASAANAQEVGRGSSAGNTGLTLREIQDIGQEAGIAPDAIARAATGLTRAPASISGTMLGLPIKVGESADLGRRLTDDEWERVVVMLREVFNARGKLDATGSFRQWTNGNLQALLEPTDTGHRLRLQTYNQQSRTFMGLGLAVTAMGALSALSASFAHVFSSDSLAAFGGLFAIGGGLFALGATRLPMWARQRRQQMREVLAWLQNSGDVNTTPDVGGESK